MQIYIKKMTIPNFLHIFLYNSSNFWEIGYTYYKNNNIMSKNDYSANTIKYIAAVKKLLKTKYGKLNDEWSMPLELLADKVELYQKCRDSINNDGLLLVAKNGSYTRNSLIKTMFDCEIQISKYLAEFGLTPRAAAKINFVGDDDEELKELLG